MFSEDPVRPTAPLLAPVEPQARIATLDVMRGLAVLGVLAVNAVSFALPMMVYGDVRLSPFPVTGANAVAHWVVEVFFQQKFITLFSMLFGASIFLVGGEQDDLARGRLLRRRLFWLAVIGLIHGLGVWYGDVLLLYAWSGVFAMLMRSLPARTLVGMGLGVTLALGAIQALMSWLAVAGPFAPTLALGEDYPASLQAVHAAIAAYRSGWAGAMMQNLRSWVFLQGLSLTMFVVPTTALMMLGMGLFKSGFFSGRASTRTYLAVIAGGGAVLALLAALKWAEIMAAPGADPTRGLAEIVNAFPVFITLAYAGVLILATTRGLSCLTAALRPVGRMAFTNYLTQSLIMASIFYMPWGPRLFGRVDYVGLWGFVLAVWAVQLVWSPLWLSVFRMGPLEWAWRRLTYGRPLPIRKAG